VQPFCYGTAGGAEIDLILEFSNTEKWGTGIKHSTSPSISKGFYIACDDVKPQHRCVLYSGKDRFSFGGGLSRFHCLILCRRFKNKDKRDSQISIYGIPVFPGKLFILIAS